MNRKYEDKLLTNREFITYKMLQWEKDFWTWFIDCVYTKDESDLENPVKSAPPYAYLKDTWDTYQKSKILVVVKSRRMFLTHFTTAIFMWYFLFKPKSKNLVFSQKEEQVADLMKNRFAELYFNLDFRFPWVRLKEGVDIKRTSIIHPDRSWGSEIVGFPTGGNQARGYTATNVLADEFAFWDNQEAAFKAIKPAIEGKSGRGLIISTPQPNTKFEELVTKKMEKTDTQFVRPGVTLYQNYLNHNVLAIKYIADPNKRTEEWYHKERFGKTPEGIPIPGESGVDHFTWLQEYELSFALPAGEPIVPEFDEELHCKPYYKYGYIEGEPLHVAFDFGAKFPAVVIFQKDNLGRCIIHQALMVENERLQLFMARVENYIRENFADPIIRLYCDPAGKARNSQGTANPAKAQLEDHFKQPVQCLYSHPKDRARAIREQASQRIGDAQGIIINPDAGLFISSDGTQRSGVMVKGFKTGWVWSEKDKLEPDKDGFYDHIFDAFGYGHMFVFASYYFKSSRQDRKNKSKKRNTSRSVRL